MEVTNGQQPVQLTDVELNEVFNAPKPRVVEQLEELNYALSRVGMALVKGGTDSETFKIRLERLHDAMSDFNDLML